MKIRKILFLGCLLISSCTQSIPQTATPVMTPGEENTAVFPVFTNTSSPIASVPSGETTQIITPLMAADFSQAKVVSVSYGETGVLIIVLEVVGGGIETGSFYGMISDQKYECTPHAVLPDRLYCVGVKPGDASGGQRELILYQTGIEQEVYRVEIILPQ